MKSSRVTTRLLACAIVLIAACDGAQQDTAIPERFQAFANAVEQERIALGAPGMAVAVVERGEVTFAHGFGLKDASRPDPVLPTTLFRIGSVTKMLTTMAVLGAVQDGKVSLDEPITTYIPAFHLNKTPADVSGIKVRHLLSHSGGLSDYAENNAPANEQSDAALEQFLTGRFADIGYVASPPDAMWSYANPDYMLAGLIAEKALATPYRTLMHDRVFAPLGLDRTFFLASEVLADGDFAVGYNSARPGAQLLLDATTPLAVQPDSYENPWARPAGFAWSSVLDLAKVARFLVHGREDFIRADLWKAMTSAQISTKFAGDEISYGFGVMVSRGLGGGPTFPYRALKMVGHDGAIPGFSASLNCVVSLDLCVIALANGNGAYLQNSMVVALTTLANMPPPDPQPDLAPKPDRYSLYAGSYEDRFGGIGKLTVSTDGATISFQAPGLDPSTMPYNPVLKPTSVDNFLVTVAGTPMPVTFIADSSGVYRYIRARPYIAVRSSEP